MGRALPSGNRAGVKYSRTSFSDGKKTLLKAAAGRIRLVRLSNLSDQLRSVLTHFTTFHKPL